MSTAARVVAVIGMVLAIAVGFAGAAVGLEVTQPLQRGSTVTVEFQVAETDNATTIANRLQSEGLIRNALVFKLLAKYRHLDTQLKAGLYSLSPADTMDKIIKILLTGVSDQVEIGPIPPGKRVTQYMTEYGELFAVLPNFKPDDFLKIATSGTLDDGTKLSSLYWYAPTKGTGVLYALEGYLFPDTLYYAGDADAGGVIERMLSDLGQQLCPGPQAHPDAYLASEQQCRAHAKPYDQLGKQTIFQALDARKLTLAQGLTIASMVEKEGRTPAGKQGVASVMYNIFQVATGAQTGPDPDGGPTDLGVDTTVLYAAGTTQNPWPDPNSLPSLKTVDPDSPYNTYTHPGLPPGPICGVDLGDIMAVLTAPKTDYYYYFFGKDNQNHYARTYYEQQQNIAQYG